MVFDLLPLLSRPLPNVSKAPPAQSERPPRGGKRRKVCFCFALCFGAEGPYKEREECTELLLHCQLWALRASQRHRLPIDPPFKRARLEEEHGELSSSPGARVGSANPSLSSLLHEEIRFESIQASLLHRLKVCGSKCVFKSRVRDERSHSKPYRGISLIEILVQPGNHQLLE